MRRFFAAFLSALLFAGQAVSAYAAGYDFSDWVPPIPSFVSAVSYTHLTLPTILLV